MVPRGSATQAVAWVVPQSVPEYWNVQGVGAVGAPYGGAVIVETRALPPVSWS